MLLDINKYLAEVKFSVLQLSIFHFNKKGCQFLENDLGWLSSSLECVWYYPSHTIWYGGPRGKALNKSCQFNKNVLLTLSLVNIMSNHFGSIK